MLHLRKLLPVCRTTAPVHYSLHRALLSTAAVGASPIHSASDDHAFTTRGLTKKHAAKAANYIDHCKSRSNADEVLSFLGSPALGLSKAGIEHLVSQDPRILNCSVEKTLRPRIDAFLSHGFTAAQIRTFLRWAAPFFRSFNVDEKLGFWVPFLGSPQNFLRILKRNSYLVTSDLERVVKVNMQQLLESGLSDADVAQLCLMSPRLLNCKTDTVRAILNRAEELGVPRNSPRFRYAVGSAACIGPETTAAKIKFIAEILRCSDAEVVEAVKMVPKLVQYSMEKIHCVSEFLTKVVGVDSKYILGRPKILGYSLERRIAPRHYVMKMLMEKGLMRKGEHGFYTLVISTDELFQSRYIIRHKDVLPGLADAYASACKGKLPT